MLMMALVALAGFILGVRVGVELGYRGERRRRAREIDRPKGDPLARRP